MADLALLAEAGELADGVLERDRGIGRVQLVDVDALEAQAAQARLAGLAQVLGPPVAAASARRPGADETALGRDHEPVRVGVERLGDQELAHLRAVGVGGVDQVHAELDGAPQRRASAFSRSSGHPRIRGPQIRMAPNPSRRTSRSPPIRNVSGSRCHAPSTHRQAAVARRPCPDARPRAWP